MASRKLPLQLIKASVILLREWWRNRREKEKDEEREKEKEKEREKMEEMKKYEEEKEEREKKEKEREKKERENETKEKEREKKERENETKEKEREKEKEIKEEKEENEIKEEKEEKEEEREKEKEIKEEKEEKEEEREKEDESEKKKDAPAKSVARSICEWFAAPSSPSFQSFLLFLLIGVVLGVSAAHESGLAANAPSCISVTAPDAPYEDDQMKEVFQLVVSAFEKLDDKSSPSFIKRTSILETVAEVRSCVEMLDLECDAPTVEMFQHFLESVRDDHPENVFPSMETIMTLVLEEREDISLDLLSSILDFLKTENKDVLTAARQLGEKVIEQYASKLKPYLLPAVKYRGASLDAYSKVVANVCQLGPEAVEPSDGDAASKNLDVLPVACQLKPYLLPAVKYRGASLDSYSKAVANVCPLGPEAVEPSDGDAASKNLADESGVAKAHSEKAVEVAMNTLDDAPSSSEVGPVTVGSPKSVTSNGTLKKEIGDTSGGSDNSKEADDVTQEKESKDVDSTPCEVDGVEHAETIKEADPVHSSPDNEPVDVPYPSPIRSFADESPTNKGGQGKKKDDKVQESGTASDVDCKKESDTKKGSEGTGLESKVQKRTVKKAADKDESVPSPVYVDASKKEDEITTQLDAKSTKQSGKMVELQREDDRKRGQGKGTPGKEPAKTPSHDKKPVSLPESAAESTKDESDVEAAPMMDSKRK